MLQTFCLFACILTPSSLVRYSHFSFFFTIKTFVIDATFVNHEIKWSKTLKKFCNWDPSNVICDTELSPWNGLYEAGKMVKLLILQKNVCCKLSLETTNACNALFVMYVIETHYLKNMLQYFYFFTFSL